jgi:hypothetical protein
MNLTVEDVPAGGPFQMGAAGEGGHALLKRGRASGKLSIGGGSERQGATACREYGKQLVKTK